MAAHRGPVCVFDDGVNHASRCEQHCLGQWGSGWHDPQHSLFEETSGSICEGHLSQGVIRGQGVVVEELGDGCEQLVRLLLLTYLIKSIVL